MQWTIRINRIAADLFPFTKKCLSHRQMMLGMRILRAERISRDIESMEPEDQEAYLEKLEQSIKLNDKEST